MLLSVFLCAPLGVLLKKIGGLENTLLHAYLFFTGMVLMAFGFYVIYSNKNMLGKEHFTTVHGIAGLVVVMGWVLMWAAGLTFLHPTYGLKSTKTNKLVRLGHKLGGRVMWIVACYACFTGFSTIEKSQVKQALLVLASVGLAPFIIL